MSDSVVETIYGKHTKYEVIKKSSSVFETKYVVKSSSGKYSGEFSSLAAAVEWARQQG